MHRLFVALRPPSALRRALLMRMGGGSGYRWEDDAQLHLTLRFIGEVDRHRAADIAAALAQVRHPPITIALDGAGVFDSRGRPDTLWAGVTPHAPLHALHHSVAVALARVGLAPEARAYLPHITVARIGRTASLVEPLLAGWSGLASPPADCGWFGLYESMLGRTGAAYDLVERYDLR